MEKKLAGNLTKVSVRVVINYNDSVTYEDTVLDLSGLLKKDSSEIYAWDIVELVRQKNPKLKRFDVQFINGNASRVIRATTTGEDENQSKTVPSYWDDKGHAWIPSFRGYYDAQQLAKSRPWDKIYILFERTS